VNTSEILKKNLRRKRLLLPKAQGEKRKIQPFDFLCFWNFSGSLNFFELYVARK